MELEYQILVNQYGQGVVGVASLLAPFESFEITAKRKFLDNLIFLMLQSKPNEGDVEPAIIDSGLKSTYTPCVLLKNGMKAQHLKRLVDLPANELMKVFVLLLSLFKIAYKRRFEAEKDSPDKWWYWDLSDEGNINRILQSH